MLVHVLDDPTTRFESMTCNGRCSHQVLLWIQFVERYKVAATPLPAIESRSAATLPGQMNIRISGAVLYRHPDMRPGKDGSLAGSTECAERIEMTLRTDGAHQ